jgi:hypothetical protein
MLFPWLLERLSFLLPELRLHHSQKPPIPYQRPFYQR